MAIWNAALDSTASLIPDPEMTLATFYSKSFLQSDPAQTAYFANSSIYKIRRHT